MEPSEFKISISVESYDGKTAENYRNCYVVEMLIVFKRFLILLAQIGELNKDCVKMSSPYLIYFMKNKPSNSVTVGSGRSIVLNDPASLK